MKNNKGITLIALIVTIIVLIILAGVAIAMLRDDNGILNNASSARYMNIIGNFDERVKMAQMSTKMNITTKMTTNNGYIATKDDATLGELATEVAKELGVTALNGKTETTDKISRSTYTVAYYLDDAGSATNNGDGYIVIWYTDNSLRSSLPNKIDAPATASAADKKVRTDFMEANNLMDQASNTGKNQFMLAAVIHVTNYNCKLVGNFATSTTDAVADLKDKTKFAKATSTDAASTYSTLYNAKLALMDNTGEYAGPVSGT